MASADFPPPLGGGISPGQCPTCRFAPSGSTVTVDDSGASLVLACSPAALGLTASSCSYGRRFASALSEFPYGLTPGFRFGCRHLPVGDLSPREVRHLPDTLGQAFQPAGSGDFPVARTRSRGWKAPCTGRLESLPYIIVVIAGAGAGVVDGTKRNGVTRSRKWPSRI
jgi:hypothetical protein